MFFVLSKIVWFILAPLNVALILLTGAMLAMTFKYNRIARRLGIAAFVVLFVFAVLPTGPLLIRYLETRHPAPADIPRPVQGIIALGYGFDADQGFRHGDPQLTGGADRITTFMKLGRDYPWAKLVYTGGQGSLAQSGTPEAAMIRPFLKNLGFNPGRRLVTEDASRTTYENAQRSRELVKPKPGDRWLLVTSAWHMPRALGAFNAAGWAVTPYPTDYLMPARYDFIGNLQLSHIAIKEIIGIAGYSATGRWSAEFLPSPP